ncbi:hypothetical protein RhiirA4_410884 [Rhizophagus irregularis]|uniref:STAS domain-containing protein n=1 Tax=Rhizophagus irregularis TaxID=588596 RepID=A0A2I1HAR1_9GLOM|nr:hypothetical protein RhiirA4_410884 [Rhizophagus irregularis]
MERFALLFLTFFSTIFISIEYSTLISVALSLMFVVKHFTYPPEHVEGVLFVRISEPLYFANTGQLKDRLRRLEEFGDMSVHPSGEARVPQIENVIFDIETMEDIDASAVQILLEIIVAYHQRGLFIHTGKTDRDFNFIYILFVSNRQIPDINRVGLNIE